MKKFVLDLIVRRVTNMGRGYVLLQLTDPLAPLPPMVPGQFVQVRVDGSSSTFLRRPISIHRVDREANELWLLVHAVGDGTRWMAARAEGDVLNVVLPLGNGFTLPGAAKSDTMDTTAADSAYAGTASADAATEPGCCLLVGGGVGTAPLLYLGEELVRAGARPLFLLGGRTAEDLLQLDLFRRLGDVFVTTEDGSAGEHGFVTQHSLWQQGELSQTKSGDGTVSFFRIYTCGPKPMMVAVARLARERGVPCEASLENLMACGLGACLCCVEDTIDGHVCVCKEGPVFSTDKLKW